MALPLVGIGFVLTLLKQRHYQHWGYFIIGFAVLFIGLQFLKDSVPDLKSNPEVLAFLSDYTSMGFWSVLLFLAIGTILTMVVQSSSAAMAITLTMAHAGWIDYPTAAAIVLGENIGTTITANLASIRTDANARRSARVHLMFNILGVVWMAVVFRPFLAMVDSVVPGNPETPDGITAHLAMFHTLFNITNSLILIWFVPQLEKLAIRLIADQEEEPKKGKKTKRRGAGLGIRRRS